MTSESNEYLKLPAELRMALLGSIWHATCNERVQAILQNGIISNALARWPAGRCRSRGGVSVFDFREQTESSLAAVTEANNDWIGWLSSNGARRCVVWLKLNTRMLESRLVTSKRLWQEHLAAQAKGVRKNPIAKVEACHEGTIPPSAIEGAILLYAKDSTVYQVVNDIQSLPASLESFLCRCPDEWADPAEVQKMMQQGIPIVKLDIPETGTKSIDGVLAEARARLTRRNG